MNNRFSYLLVGCMFPFVSFHAQESSNFPPRYSVVNDLTDYVVWQLVYPDSLLGADVAGEAVCRLHIDSLGAISSKSVEATHPLFTRAVEEVIGGMHGWQPAKRTGKNVDSTIVLRIPFEPDAYNDRVWRQQQVLEPCRGQDADSIPRFPDDIRRLVMGNMSWPNDSVDKAVAICRFTVDERGKVGNVRVIKGTHPAFDEESIRILSNFPRLIPAMKNGKHVAYDYFLTMRFWKEDWEHYNVYRACAQKNFEANPLEHYGYSFYPGGTAALVKFIGSHLKITPEMKATGKRGRVIYSFNVDIDGSMMDFQLLKGLDPLMDAEALRVLQLVDEKWSTGYCFNFKKWYKEFHVSQFTIPIIFTW
ncbi:energy transducer TonB [Phocaeicola sp.]|uniref:energy transducer TonB n=1 Tax=Phocaeicola sp. TaxID=2773926 RepID=UPI0023D62E79|nr:energy transducer TonB [Phocaeicola sp.]MDE5676724.1 energy transducer TonB [Phocaeicola sp.]